MFTDHDFLRDGLSAIASAATTLTGWSLAILGGTVIGIVGSNYLRPSGSVRYFYLLFLPGWISLGISLLYGDKVARRFAACAFTRNHEFLTQIGQSMNTEYGHQRFFFQLALLVFGLWIICLLIWWVFARNIGGKTSV